MPDVPDTVFVYGTLTEPTRVDIVLDDWRFDGEAVLDGLHRVEGRYPTLAPGGRTEGRLLVTPEIETLDAYERFDRELYVRVAVPMTEGGEAWVYVGDPAKLDAPADWPGEGPFSERVQRHVDTAGIHVRRARNR